MNNREQIEGNLLIAQFMGKKVYPDRDTPKYKKWKGAPCDYHTFQLLYHSDWNWLMPVVEKIETEDIEVFMPDTRCTISGHSEAPPNIFTSGDTKIEAVWQAVVAFVKWHQTQTT